MEIQQTRQPSGTKTDKRTVVLEKRTSRSGTNRRRTSLIESQIYTRWEDPATRDERRGAVQSLRVQSAWYTSFYADYSDERIAVGTILANGVEQLCGIGPHERYTALRVPFSTWYVGLSPKPRRYRR